MKQYSIKNGKLPISHRSTAYPCCLPTLGEWAGAGRIGLAAANVIQQNQKNGFQRNFISEIYFY